MRCLAAQTSFYAVDVHGNRYLVDPTKVRSRAEVRGYPNKIWNRVPNAVKHLASRLLCLDFAEGP